MPGRLHQAALAARALRLRLTASKGRVGEPPQRVPPLPVARSAGTFCRARSQNKYKPNRPATRAAEQERRLGTIEGLSDDEPDQRAADRCW